METTEFWVSRGLGGCDLDSISARGEMPFNVYPVEVAFFAVEDTPDQRKSSTRGHLRPWSVNKSPNEGGSSSARDSGTDGSQPPTVPVCT